MKKVDRYFYPAIFTYEEEIPIPTRLLDISPAKNERVVLIDVYMPSIRLAFPDIIGIQ